MRFNPLFNRNPCRAIPLWLTMISAAAAGAADKAPPATAVPAGHQKPVPVGQAWGFKYPEQIVLVVSQGSNGPANIMTAGWFMPCGDPPSLAVAIAKARHTHGLIQQTGQFVVAFPGENLEREMLFCGTKSGREVAKFPATGLTPRPAKTVQPPLIDECIVNFECEKTHAVDVGSHTIFVGRIVGAWQHEKAESMRRIYTLGGQGGRQFGAWPAPEK